MLNAISGKAYFVPSFSLPFVTSPNTIEPIIFIASKKVTEKYIMKDIGISILDKVNGKLDDVCT